MASNSTSEYKVVADKIVSPDEDIIVQVRGAMYKDSITEQNRYVTVADGLTLQILDAHDTYEDFIAEHPTGNPGDLHIVAGALYAWSTETSEWLNSGNLLVGPTGPSGADGSDGAIGATGPTGAAGSNGAVGPTGATGATGASGTEIDLLNISSNIIPVSDNLYSLGTAEKRWSGVHVGPGTIYITDKTLLTNVELTVDNGVLQIDGANQLQAGQYKFGDNTVQSTAYVVPADTEFAVVGGTIGGPQPTFNGAPRFTGSYVRHGSLVTFRVNVDMSNITSFGTGQYFIELPFNSKYGITMRDGCLHDASNSNEWAISGHVVADSKVLELHYTSGTGQDEAFDRNSPINLTTADTFHVSGTYIV